MTGRPAVRVGVVGTGVMGAGHARMLARELRGAELAAVADADAGRAAVVARDLGGARVHADPLALVADPDVDAVVVASSDDTHETFVLACLRAGKPVLCEKPLAATAEACLRIVETEAAGGRRLVHVGFMRRFDPGYLTLKATLADESIGLPLLAHCVHRNPGVPPGFTSEMLITSSAVHEIDAMRWLLGEEFVAATVRVPRSTRRGRGLRDPQLVLLESESGVLVDVEVFAEAGYGYDIRCEVVGEDGTAALATPRAVELRRAGLEGAAVPDGFLARFAAAYRLELQGWVGGLLGDGFDGPTAWDGYAASAVAQACVASLASGERCPVRLAGRPALQEG